MMPAPVSIRGGIVVQKLLLIAVLAAMPFAAAVAQDQPPEHHQGGERQQEPGRPGTPPGHGPYRPGQYGNPPPHGEVYPHGPVGPGVYGHGPVGPGPANFHRFAVRDFAHFSPQEQVMWRGGGWRHEFHNGRWGWWWFVGGGWYFYDQPIYPYPAYVSDVVYEEPVEQVVQPVEQVDPAAPPPPPPAPTGQVYYYCPGVGYYPQVPTCSVPFQVINN
jgi:hypothetical protein